MTVRVPRATDSIPLCAICEQMCASGTGIAGIAVTSRQQARVSVAEQVAKVGLRLLEELAPRDDQAQVLPRGGADAPVSYFEDARARKCGDDRGVGGDDRL